MPEARMTDATHSHEGDSRKLRILAKALYKELKADGHSRSDIVEFTNQLLDLVTSDFKQNGSGPS